MSLPVELTPHHDEDEEPHESNIIENISTLRNRNNDSTDRDDVGIEPAQSLSTGTSATSIASALSDGTSRPSSRPRSSSLGLIASGRPRSNPRTRTPRRRESPLLVTGSRVVMGEDAGRNVAAGTPVNYDRNEVLTASANGANAGDNSVRNLFNTRRNRALSIPEEEAVGVTNRTAIVAPPLPPPQAAGHFLAQAAAATASNARNNRSANPTSSRGLANNSGLSGKQRPSHRKQRRWNNDRFVGTPSEQLHLTLQNDAGAEAELYWREFYMPHYPLEYRSEFAKLVADESEFGKSMREKFAKGEVASGTTADGGKEGRDGYERVMAKFRKMGIAALQGEANAPEMGKKLFHSLNPRIRSVVSRSCTIDDFFLKNKEAAAKDAGCSFASRVVTAFESYIVSLAIVGSKTDFVAAKGYPPRQSQPVYDIFDKIFSSPPKVVIRRKKLTNHKFKHVHAVLVPTIHFYFSAADGSGNAVGNGADSSKDDGRFKSTAFYRILLYAVCHFHGLESSSSNVAPNNGTTKQQTRQKRNSNEQGVAKVVTVQGGVLLAPALKLLDHVQ